MVTEAGGVPFDDPSAFLARFMKLTNELMAPFSAHLEKRYSINVNEYRVLMSIGRLGAAASHELAEATGVHPMAISRGVSKLIRDGHVVFDHDAGDKRRKILRLTDSGRDLYKRLKPQSDKVARYVWSALQPDEAMALDRFIRTISAKLNERDLDGKLEFIESTRLDE